MINTYNRQPISFGSNKDYDKQFLYGSFNGINDNKNVLSVDQESFADANNIYVSDDNLLVSRPPIKSIGITNVLKLWTFNNKILVLKNDFNLLAYNKLDEEPIATLQYDVPAGEYKINCLQVENKIYVFTDLTINNNSVFYALFLEENEFKNAIDYVYIPLTKLVTNNVDEEYESANFLTSADKTRFLYSALSFVDFSRLMGKKVTVNLDNKEYVIDEWKQDNEKVLVSAYSNIGEDDYIDIKEASGVKIILKYNKRTKNVSISYDGVIFKNLPYVDNIVPNTIPYLSEDGFNVFIFTLTSLKRCTIAALVDQVYEQKPMFVWEDIPYCNTNNSYYKGKQLNSKSRAYGSFISQDVYAYIVTCENPIRNDLQSAILFLRLGTEGCLKVLSIHAPDIPDLFFKFNHSLLEVNDNKVPDIVSIIINDKTARLLNLTDDNNSNGIGVIMIREKSNTINSYIYNGEILDIKGSFYAPKNKNAVQWTNGYAQRDYLYHYTNEHLYGFKLQRWIVSGTTAVIDTSNTVLKYGDYVSLIPLVNTFNTDNDTKYENFYDGVEPCPPFKRQTGLKQDLYLLSGDTTGTNLYDGSYINLVDQNTYNGVTGGEDISGTILRPEDVYEFDTKVVQLNYYTGSQPSLSVLKNRLHFFQELSEFSDSKEKPDNTIIMQSYDSETNKVKYDIKTVAALRYDINDTPNNLQDDYVANVINDVTLEWNAENNTCTIPDKCNLVKKIPCLYNSWLEQIVNEAEYSDFNIEFFAQRFRFDKSANYLLSDQYYYDIERDKVTNFIIGESSSILTIPKQNPILFGDYIYYTYDNKLYTNETIKQITLDIINNEHSYTQKVFDKKAVLNEYFLSFGNLLEISRIRRNADNETMLYLPKINEFTYTGDINELHLLSSSEVGVFLDSEIWTIKSLGLDNNRTYELWSNIRTKLNLGIKAGSEVITAIDGSSVIFATPRGIANMHYQENVQSADQILGYLSNNIQYTYDYYKDKSIKFVVHKYLILCYLENDKNILLFDIKRNAWWKWSYKANITKIFAYNDIVYILSNNSLYKFDTQFEDYTDDGDKIDWFITTQKLHFGNLNNTKFVKRLTIMALGDTKEICKVRTNMFRQLNHTVKEDYLDIEIDDLRTLVKKFSFMSVNQFQLMLSADLEDVNHYQLKINTIGITYQLKGGI